MSLQGEIRERGGKLYVVYASEDYSRPSRTTLWWRVVQTTASAYGFERPAAGDVATSGGGGQWSTRNPVTHRGTGGVSTGNGSAESEFREETPVLPPPARGKELRWMYGKWEKLTAKGWVQAGEGTEPKAKPSKKSKAQIEREVEALLEAGKR